MEKTKNTKSLIGQLSFQWEPSPEQVRTALMGGSKFDFDLIRRTATAEQRNLEPKPV